MRADWITSRDEPIIELLSDYHHSNYDPLFWAIEKGLVEKRPAGKYDSFHFTEQGMKEILEPMRDAYCISGRKIR